MRFRFTQDALAVTVFLLLLVWCWASWILYRNYFWTTHPGSYAPDWILPLVVLDASVIGLAIAGYVLLARRLPA